MVSEIVDIDKRVDATTDTMLLEEKWFVRIAQKRFDDPDGPVYLDAPVSSQGESCCNSFLHSMSCTFSERLLWTMPLLVHIRTDLLNDIFFNRKNQSQRKLFELGGVTGRNYHGFLPTGLTYVYLLAGRNTGKRTEVCSDLLRINRLITQGTIRLIGEQEGDPAFSGVITLSEHFIRTTIFEITDSDCQVQSGRVFEKENGTMEQVHNIKEIRQPITNTQC